MARRSMSPHAGPAVAALLCSLSVAVSDAALAGEPLTPQAAIEARQAGFRKMGSALKAITEQLKGESPDSSMLAASAEAITAGAVRLTQWFPAGSGASGGLETDALPNIWTDRAKFDALANDLVAEMKSLTASIAAKDVAALRAQAKRTGSVCSTCHRSFRAD